MGLSVSQTKLTILTLLVTLMIDVGNCYGGHWCHSGYSSRTLSTYEEPAGYSIADYEYTIGTGNYQFTVPQYD
jgi:hypothetical protein